MDLLQAWVAVGLPALVVAGGLFTGRSRTRALVGYVVLLAVMAFLVTIPGGALSAAAVGVLGVAFVATGRGTVRDDRYREHHELRQEYTRVGGDD